MASFQVVGFITNVKYLQDSCILYVDEFKKGYKKSDGTIVGDKSLSWKIIYKGYFKKYINAHFKDGMLVEVKGDVLPYAVEHGSITEGYSVIGQTVNLFSYPRAGAKEEAKMLTDSQLHDDSTPDIDKYNEPDF